MRRKRKIGTVWASTLEAQAAMWAVLGARVPQLLSGRMSLAEQTRMVTEKTEAMAESQMAAATAATRAIMKSAYTPTGFSSAAMSIAAAAFGPYHRKVTANAKRLTKTRKTRSP